MGEKPRPQLEPHLVAPRKLRMWIQGLLVFFNSGKWCIDFTPSPPPPLTFTLSLSQLCLA